MDIRCPSCGESDELSGRPGPDGIDLTCGRCRHEWRRESIPRCRTCGSTDLQRVPLAIVEKSRGTQLSVVGTRPVHLCRTCDADSLERWQRNRPNPLMPDQLPTVDPD